MPHLHLSLQAMDDLILKRMKRRHSRAEALAIAARPGGAPGRRLRRRPDRRLPDRERGDVSGYAERRRGDGLTYLHVFPYSPRPNTPAARMPQVPGPAPRTGRPAARGGCSGAPPVLPAASARRRRCWWKATVPAGARGTRRSLSARPPLSGRNRARWYRFASMPPTRSGSTRRWRRDRERPHQKARGQALVSPTAEPRRG